jgi:hypothetical protein
VLLAQQILSHIADCSVRSCALHGRLASSSDLSEPLPLFFLRHFRSKNTIGTHAKDCSIMEAIFEVVAALAKAIGYLLQFIFEVVCEVVCFPMMIIAFISVVYAGDIKFSDRWERRISVFVAFWHVLFDICVFIPA